MFNKLSRVNEIKELESAVKIVKIFTETEITKIKDLYYSLPVTVHNKEQNNIKKQWIQNSNKELENIYYKKINEVVGDFKMDTLKDKNNNDCYGLFHESFKPLPLHVDTGFNKNNLPFKQLLTPLSDIGQTIIFKNRWYGQSAIFTIDKEELKFKPNDHQNIRSNKHITKDVKFNEKIHKRYLRHIDINNLDGMEVEFIYEWKIGETLIFDRTHLHSASCNIGTKKLSLATFTKK